MSDGVAGFPGGGYQYVVQRDRVERVLIVGQGLAGTALAWRLEERGVPFLIVDGEEPVTSSKIAAGLITPITGMRISLSKGYAEQWPEAVLFYRRLEALLGGSFFHELRHVRLFKNEVEPDRWMAKCGREEFRPFLSGEELALHAEVFRNPCGGFEMTGAGRLDTAQYLALSREHFHRAGCYERGEVNEVDRTDLGVEWQGRKFSHVVWCIGWQAAKHPQFEWVPFKVARGAILSVKADVGEELRVVHHGCWMVPLGRGMLRVGSTYDTDFVEPHKVTSGDRKVLHQRMNAALRVPFEVLDSASAVRPIIAAQRTLIGRHPANDRVCFFNGLASKGALRAPHFARLLSEHLLDGAPLPVECDLRSNF